MFVTFRYGGSSTLLSRSVSHMSKGLCWVPHFQRFPHGSETGLQPRTLRTDVQLLSKALHCTKPYTLDPKP